MGSLQQQSVLKGEHVSIKHETCLVHKIFNKIAYENPNKPAVLYEDDNGQERVLSYEELNSITKKIAIALRKLAKPQKDVDALIAVSMNPTDRLPITLLSILKAGMAYLPLDPEFPVPRVTHILQESEPLLVIYEEGADASIYGSSRTISYERLLDLANEEIESDLDLDQKDEDLAIVLYTSGSTGVPKGVRLPHATLMNRLCWQWRTLPYGEDEKVCVFKTALTFVDSASEIWAPLLQGRTILVVPKHVTKDPERFVEVLEKRQIKRLVLVPSLLQSLLMYLGLREEDYLLNSLKLWICSGEPLPVSLAHQFLSRFPSGEHVLANFYGSTEVMGDVTYHLLSRPNQLQGLDKVPIGRPLDNCIVYLVDKHMRLVPQGEVGELVVAGRNLAAGYIRRRDAHKFLDNPHVIDPGYSKIYCTGDYARIVKGLVIYEGRTDSQVKVRGHRVDLAEVEKAVAAAPGVNKAVVLCYKPGELSQALVAFVNVKEDTSISGLQIESFLQNTLPPYMIPQVIVLDSIPLLVNGKTDRQALLRKYETITGPDSEEVVECDYTGVPVDMLPMAKVLFPTVAFVVGRSSRAAVTVNSNFYELGGNSLNSIYTVTKLRDQGYQIGITDFITAKSMLDILIRMKSDSDAESVGDNDSLDNYIVEKLNDSHKDDVIRMITDSFYSKADLEYWLMPDISREDYSDLMIKMWEPLVEKGFSFVIKSLEGEAIGVALNFDARDEPEVMINSKLTIIFEFLEYLEGPIRDSKLPNGLGQILHSFMMATNQSLSGAENVTVMRKMEEECLRLARRKEFAGIFTTNTSPLTQQLGTDIYGYQVLLDYQVNKYIAPDGSKPFGKAPDEQRAVCSWKSVH
ncbi:uncharacterized protein LOC107273239 [Cephus cinctus]|uniref:Uncharacterized protein LOC107273239 n=1 Tax=Cephus cinctus TaxID=211228 RepID=A0AAJ7FSX6_CEPCN|nr:uncharacterized protein LOC107273239 [Cephus cinctus]XP_015606703.1 uncharacterized protein LOC107273239 [Cephus cinctus]